MPAWFVTGTDTGCGKTAVSVALLEALSKHGSACGYKPVAAGCDKSHAGWVNEDAIALMQASQPLPSYQQVNPYALPDAIAPHIAADNIGVTLGAEKIEQGFAALQQQYQHVLVEGAGGWHVPLNLANQLWFSDIPARLNIPVILVVGLKLGCINHATLTARAILESGNRLLGWVANQVDADMEAAAANLETLQTVLSQQLQLPQIAQFGFEASGKLPAEKIRLQPLLLPN